MNTWTFQKIETLEDFIKCEASDYKINTDTANEILRIIREIKEQIVITA